LYKYLLYLFLKSFIYKGTYCIFIVINSDAIYAYISVGIVLILSLNIPLFFFIH